MFLSHMVQSNKAISLYMKHDTPLMMEVSIDMASQPSLNSSILCVQLTDLGLQFCHL